MGIVKLMTNRSARLPQSSETHRKIGDFSDEELVTEYLAGNVAAYEELYDRYFDRVYRQVFARLLAVHDAEDVTQNIFMGLCRKLSQFRGDSKFSTWLYTVTQNAVYDFTRRQKVRAVTSTLSLDSGSDSDQPIELEAGGPGPAAMFEEKEDLDMVKEKLKQLPEEQREVIILRFIYDKSYSDIASELGIEMGTVKSRLNRGLNSLKRLMGIASGGS